jgi:hypothetical protein
MGDYCQECGRTFSTTVTIQCDPATYSTPRVFSVTAPEAVRIFRPLKAIRHVRSRTLSVLFLQPEYMWKIVLGHREGCAQGMKKPRTAEVESDDH